MMLFRSSATANVNRALRSFSTIDIINDHVSNNVSPAIASKVGRNLHLQKDHPLNNIRLMIENHFKDQHKLSDGSPQYKFFSDLSPIVTVEQNFDQLLVPQDHVSRAPSDTFYIDNAHVLRCHTSAHQNHLIASGETAFLCTGDVYRRDTVDASHYPVFHQMEGVRIFGAEELPDERSAAIDFVEADLKDTLEKLSRTLFGDVEMRWVDAYFPFTDPSLELEIFFNDEWLEVLGSGVIQHRILQQCAVQENSVGWAFGLGLERLAMVLHDIPDIRLFWSTDDRFLSQFTEGEVNKFKSFSKYPPCHKDISFWLTDDFHVHDMHDAVRTVAGDLVESVSLIDEFTHPKTGRTSHCYRITYRNMERSLTNEEVDRMQHTLRDVVRTMNCELR